MAIGYERKGELVGAVVFSGYSGANMILGVALEAPLTRVFMRAIFLYPFVQMKCRRVTALVDESNVKSRRLIEHAGFRYEGTMEDGAPGGNVLLYGMTKARCRWIKGFA